MSVQTKESGVVHFRVAEDAGVLVMTIAQEHLIYDLDVDKALKTLTDCLMGCPMDLALKILVGDYVINTDVDEQQFYVGERQEMIHDKLFPKIDVFDWCRKKSIEIAKNGDELKYAIDNQVSKIKYKSVHVTYSYEQILAFIGGDNDEIIEDLKERSEVLQLSSLIKVTKNYIDKSIKLRKVIDWLEKTYPEKFSKLDMDMEDLWDSSRKLTTVMQKFQSMIKCEWDSNAFAKTEMETELENYITASVEIQEVIDKGIEPVNIMDNYSAGWLSPDGLYYALNGEIANMLHNQIADALQEKGIVPNEPIDNNRKVNPDQWLEEHGWVKIHGSNINFDGCNNFERGKKNVDITNVQLKKIYEYCSICHNGIIKVGWRLEPMSATRFRDMYENNSEGVNKKYFEY